MGSMLFLSLGRLEIDWGKNYYFRPYNSLFSKEDQTQIPYYYAGELIKEDEEIVEFEDVVHYKTGFSRVFEEILDRLNLLGYTMDSCREEYNICLARWVDHPQILPFENLVQALIQYDISNMPRGFPKAVLDGPLTKEIYVRVSLQDFIAKLESDEILENRATDSVYDLNDALVRYDPLCLLRILGENESNLSLNVMWKIADVAENWAGYEAFEPKLQDSDKILIVTEGSSDSRILKRAFSILRPHIADFFQFVDMEENYPFTGTGNVYRFVQGLASINIFKKIVVLYDNDAEGIYNYNRSQELELPPNIRIARLPDLDELSHFLTVGPDGETYSDINGSAASIECYLDLNQLNEEPRVRWKSWHQKLQRYQGVIETKRNAMNDFLSIENKNSNYDFSKIEVVLDHLIAECIKVAEATRHN